MPFFKTATYTFRTAFRKLVPWWLSEGEGELVLYTLGILKDAFVDRAFYGTMYRFPEYAPEDALAVLGQARRMRRGNGEARESYARRLTTWRQFHKTNGNPFGMLRQIRTFLGKAVRVRTVDARGNWYTIEADGTQSYQWGLENWNWDGEPSTPGYARFWVILYSTGANAPWRKQAVFGDDGPLLGDPSLTLGTTATPEEADSLLLVIKESMPLHTHFETLIVAFTDTKFDPTTPEPDGTWRDYSENDGGAQTATRDADSRYWFYHGD